MNKRPRNSDEDLEMVQHDHEATPDPSTDHPDISGAADGEAADGQTAGAESGFVMQHVQELFLTNWNHFIETDIAPRAKGVEEVSSFVFHNVDGKELLEVCCKAYTCRVRIRSCQVPLRGFSAWDWYMKHLLGLSAQAMACEA